MIETVSRVVLFCAALALLGGAHAQVSEAERQALIDFYHATGGDDWHNNDGWLGEAGSECDWHGVACTGPDGEEIVFRLELPDNGLVGTLPDSIAGLARLQRLDLGRNQLSGDNLAQLFALPQLANLQLNHNPLGMLPASLSDAVAPLFILNLSSTGLEADPPEWFGDLSLRELDLSGNLLHGEPGPWLAALHDEQRITLDLSRNFFNGPLPEALLDIDFAHANMSSGPGLNLCWNDYDEPFTSEFEEFLGHVHVAGKLSDCNGRELTEVDATISGSWYDPEHSGKGYTTMLLDNGQLLYYWFGYPSFAFPSHPFDEVQKWSFQLVAPDGHSARFPQAMAPFGGHFGVGLGDGTMGDVDRREVEMVRGADGEIIVTTTTRPGVRGIVSDPPAPPWQERLDHRRLTELAGTHCDNRSPYQDYSGAWFNPDLDGEGFILEVLPDDQGLVYWFTYAPDGSGRQAWMIGLGQFDTGGITIGTPPPGTPEAWLEIERMDQPVGTELGPNFDSEAVDRIDWGSLMLGFHEDGTAQVAWDSHLDEYGSGDHELQRLARPMLAECED
jgi:hypothetical protein